MDQALRGRRHLGSAASHVFLGPIAACEKHRYGKTKRKAAMTLAYGFVKTKITSEPKLKPSRHSHETQFHLHCNLDVDGDKWDVAINVGTNDADDLLKYKLAFDFRHPIIQTLGSADAGSRDLTGQTAFPALE